MSAADMKFFVFLLAIFVVKAQHQIELQYIGNSLSEDQAINRELCRTKYCLLDAESLFYSASQDKSIKPCDDFREFAVGTFLKYRSVNDRNPKAGFINDNGKDHREKMRKVLAAPINGNDTRVTKGMKEIYAKCVDSHYISSYGVSEIRKYARSVGLNFYPETNQREFNLSQYFEQQPQLALPALFFASLTRPETPITSKASLALSHYQDEFTELRISSYKSMLYDMNDVYLNGSYADEFNEEFSQIVIKQSAFHKSLLKVQASIEVNKTVELTIEELNQLTSSLNIDWLKVINKQLLTKVEKDELIAVVQPEKIQKLAEHLSTIYKESRDDIANYLVYDFLYTQSQSFILYAADDYKTQKRGAKKAQERWQQCMGQFSRYMRPAQEFLYLETYRDQTLKEAMINMAQQTINFAVEKILPKSQWEEKVKREVMTRLRNIRITVGYPDDFVSPEKIEEIYRTLKFGDELNYAELMYEMEILYQQIIREPTTSKTRKAIALRKLTHGFEYIIVDDHFHIPLRYLKYPFFHHQRSQFFNSATVSEYTFRALHNALNVSLHDEFGVKDFDLYRDSYQLAYEYYDDWLKSGEKERELGANRLTNQQLYWVAAAKIYYPKYQFANLSKDPFEYQSSTFLSSKVGFKEAYHCE